MGGDHAPEEIVKGALLAVKEYPVEVVLVGQEEVVRKEFVEQGPISSPLHLFGISANYVLSSLIEISGHWNLHDLSVQSRRGIDGRRLRMKMWLMAAERAKQPKSRFATFATSSF